MRPCMYHGQFVSRDAAEFILQPPASTAEAGVLGHRIQTPSLIPPIRRQFPVPARCLLCMHTPTATAPSSIYTSNRIKSNQEAIEMDEEELDRLVFAEFSEAEERRDQASSSSSGAGTQQPATATAAPRRGGPAQADGQGRGGAGTAPAAAGDEEEEWEAVGSGSGGGGAPAGWQAQMAPEQCGILKSELEGLGLPDPLVASIVAAASMGKCGSGGPQAVVAKVRTC